MAAKLLDTLVGGGVNHLVVSVHHLLAAQHLVAVGVVVYYHINYNMVKLYLMSSGHRLPTYEINRQI